MRYILRARALGGQRWLGGLQSQGRNSMRLAALFNTARLNSSTAKYSLRKLDSQEVEDLKDKIAEYSQPRHDSTPQDPAKQSSLAPGASEAASVRLTESAISRLKHLSEQRKKTQYLRLRVDSGGCYGFSYMLDMTEEPEEDDIIIDRQGAKMVIDNFSLPLVRGATIDWQDRLIGQAFLVVANPQSSGGCGCGASFEIKMD